VPAYPGCPGKKATLETDVVVVVVDTYLGCEDIAGQSCAMVPRRRIFGDFLRPAFSVSHVQHVSDMHPKFALRPRYVWKYGRHPICDG